MRWHFGRDRLWPEYDLRPDVVSGPWAVLRERAFLSLWPRRRDYHGWDASPGWRLYRDGKHVGTFPTRKTAKAAAETMG